jgi:hypothetical protein
MTPECHASPERAQLLEANQLSQNPRGPLHVTGTPLADIGR